MKKTLIILLLAVIYLPGKANRNDVQTISDEQSDSILVSKVISEAGIAIKKVKFELVRTKMLPYDHSKTVVSVPVIAEEGDHYFVLDAHVFVVSTKTGEILHQYTEEGFWESDAIILDDITIDTAPYRLNEQTRAFGIVTQHRGSSMPNPYSSGAISMFISKGKTLIKVLDKLYTGQFSGEYDTRCAGRFKDEKSTISISANKTNGYADLIINHKTVYSEATLKGEDCDEKVVKRVNKTTILKYRGGEYK